MDEEWKYEAIKLVGNAGNEERCHAADIVEAKDLRAQRGIFVIVAVNEGAVLARGDAALTVHLDAAGSSLNLTVHVCLEPWNRIKHWLKKHDKLRRWFAQTDLVTDRPFLQVNAPFMRVLVSAIARILSAHRRLQTAAG